jgi:hypothetical protein
MENKHRINSQENHGLFNLILFYYVYIGQLEHLSYLVILKEIKWCIF